MLLLLQSIAAEIDQNKNVRNKRHKDKQSMDENLNESELESNKISKELVIEIETVQFQSLTKKLLRRPTWRFDRSICFYQRKHNNTCGKRR